MTSKLACALPVFIRRDQDEGDKLFLATSYGDPDRWCSLPVGGLVIRPYITVNLPFGIFTDRIYFSCETVFFGEFDSQTEGCFVSEIQLYSVPFPAGSLFVCYASTHLVTVKYFSSFTE